MTRKTSSATHREQATLVGHLDALMQGALEAHEALELTSGRSPVAELCEVLGLDPLAVPLEQLATTLISFLVLGQPTLTRSQETLQERLLEGLARGPRMLFRQLRNEPLRAWRYLPQPASRDVAAQMVGPDAAREEFFDALIELPGARAQPHGGGCLGWPMTSSSGRQTLVAAAMLSAQSAQAIEALTPFPMPRSERAFWLEQLTDLLLLAVDPQARMRTDAATQAQRETLHPSAFRDGARLVMHPATTPGELLERLIVAADFELVATGTSWYSPRVHRVRHTREVIARARHEHELDALVETLHVLRHQLLGWSGHGRFAGPDDPALEAWLPMQRVLEGFGLRRDATMPAAEPRVLKTHPLSVLQLDAQHPVFDEVHVREPIRQALDWAKRHPQAGAAISEAFERYSDERRWVATFAPLDLGCDEHLARIDLVTLHHALTTLMDPRAAQTPLDELGLDARHTGWLEAALRPTPHTEANVLRVRDLPASEAEVLALRNIGQGALVQLKRALVRLADGWRAHAAGLDPRSLDTRRSAPDTPTSDASLSDGLDELAALFGRDS